jgi:hypothetical protein
VYVPGSRGTDANTFYVICQHAPDHHDPERLDRTPVAVLTDILTRPIDRNTAAEIARRAGADETRSPLSRQRLSNLPAGLGTCTPSCNRAA